MPERFDRVELLARPFGQRGLGQPRRDADAQAAGDELQQRPAPGRIEPVEPALEDEAGIRARRCRKLGDDLGQAGHVAGALARGPDERHGLGEIADEIVRPGEERLVDPRQHEVADRRRLDRCKRDLAGQRGQGPAALGIGCGGEIVLHQAQLAEARRREEKRVEEAGETLHYSSSASKPTRCRGRAAIPMSPAWRTSASSAPCVTHTSCGANSRIVCTSSSQSA